MSRFALSETNITKGFWNNNKSFFTFWVILYARIGYQFYEGCVLQKNRESKRQSGALSCCNPLVRSLIKRESLISPVCSDWHFGCSLSFAVKWQGRDTKTTGGDSQIIALLEFGITYCKHQGAKRLILYEVIWFKVFWLGEWAMRQRVYRAFWCFEEYGVTTVMIQIKRN